MQFTTAIIALGALATSAVASSIPYDINAATPYPINSTLKWTGESKGVPTTLYGTLPEITSQLQALDPDWKPVVADLSQSTGASTVDKRQCEPTYTCCPVGDYNWQAGDYYTVNVEITTIIIAGGSLGVSPNTCLQVTSSIWTCNAGNTYIEADTLDIATEANHLLKCTGAVPVCGQGYSCGGFNVIVHHP